MGTKLNVSADGRYVVAVLLDVPKGYDPLNLHPCYTPPLTRLARIDVADGDEEVLPEDRRFIGHLNTSPARAELLTCTHEGHISVDDQRIHGLNMLAGENRVIRPQRGDVRVVAEHWFADGETLGFRCHNRADADTRFGSIRFDNTGHVETVLPYSRHFHSLDGSLVVGDGAPVFQSGHPGTRLVTWPCILLHPWEGEGWGSRRSWRITAAALMGSAPIRTRTSRRTAGMCCSQPTVEATRASIRTFTWCRSATFGSYPRWTSKRASACAAFSRNRADATPECSVGTSLTWSATQKHGAK